MTRWFRSFAVVCFVFAIWGKSAAAAPVALRSASPAQSAAAQALFDSARALRTEGKIAKACARFEENLRLDVGIGTQFNLADCYERIERTASAYALYREVASSARRMGQMARATAAAERNRDLAQRLSSLTLNVAFEPPPPWCCGEVGWWLVLLCRFALPNGKTHLQYCHQNLREYLWRWLPFADIALR